MKKKDIVKVTRLPLLVNLIIPCFLEKSKYILYILLKIKVKNFIINMEVSYETRN